MHFWRIICVAMGLAVSITTSGHAAPAAIWFEDARHSPDVTSDMARSLAAHVRHRLLPPETPDQAPLLAGSLRDDFHPRVVFISASDGIRPARVSVGSARGLLKAADAAIAQLLPTDKDRFEPRWLRLDLPATILLQENVDLNRKLDYERSLFGIAFPRATPIALLPEELIANDVVNHLQEFFTDPFNACVDARRPAVDRTSLKLDTGNATLFRFSLQSWSMDRSEIVPLYRGHRTVHRITREELKQSVKAAATYLTQAVNSNGRFAYLYQPNVNLLGDDYDMATHLGAVVSMMDAHETLHDPQLIAAAKRALDFADASIGLWARDGNRIPALVEKGRVTLGGNAMATAALARYAKAGHDANTLDRAKSFANAVVAAQQSDGSFIQLQRFPDGEAFQMDHPDQPGQAIFALMQMQKAAPDSRWVQAAGKAAQHLIVVHDKGLKLAQLPHDFWLLRGLNELHRIQPREIHLEHTARIVRAMCRAQHRSPPFTDWLGGYDSPPGSTPTAVRLEGMIAAYSLLRDHGGAAYREDAAAALDACIAAAAFELQCQFRPESAMYYKDPQRILGAFRESLTTPFIRIDFVEHNMTALLHLWRIMEAENVASFAVPPPVRPDDDNGADAKAPVANSPSND